MKKRFLTVALVSVFALFALLGCASPVSPRSSAQVYAVPGGNIEDSFTDTVSYSRKVHNLYMITPDIPGYNLSTNTCGVIAGSNIVSWYNKQYTNLVHPNHSPGYTWYGIWFWTMQNSYIDNVFASLSTAMNEDTEGVTIPNYLGGMNSYVTSKNRTFTSTRLMNSNGTLNYSAAKTALNSGKLISIFMNDFNICGVQTVSQGFDRIPTETYVGAHVMSVYGWEEIEYYNAQNVKFRHDTYFKVHTGYGGIKSTLKLNQYITIDDCYITHIS